MSEPAGPRPSDWPHLSDDAATQPYVWLTTRGRSTGVPRTVELWFILDGNTVHMLAGGGEAANWVRNALAHPDVSLHLAGTDYRGHARAPSPGSDEDMAARRALAAKYQGWRDGQPLSRWATSSYCMAIDLEVPRE